MSIAKRTRFSLYIRLVYVMDSLLNILVLFGCLAFLIFTRSWSFFFLFPKSWDLICLGTFIL
uniref:Uncharacterized protein n=1 Tax=Rhizophora mucronata TaxID=61149 RepID=A0A2P2LZK1_RHIMU